TPSSRYSGERAGERGELRVENVRADSLTRLRCKRLSPPRATNPSPRPSTHRCAVTSGVPVRGSARLVAPAHNCYPPPHAMIEVRHLSKVYEDPDGGEIPAVTDAS